MQYPALTGPLIIIVSINDSKSGSIQGLIIIIVMLFNYGEILYLYMETLVEKKNQNQNECTCIPIQQNLGDFRVGLKLKNTFQLCSTVILVADINLVSVDLSVCYVFWQNRLIFDSGPVSFSLPPTFSSHKLDSAHALYFPNEFICI